MFKEIVKTLGYECCCKNKCQFIFPEQEIKIHMKQKLSYSLFPDYFSASRDAIIKQETQTCEILIPTALVKYIANCYSSHNIPRYN